MLTDTKFILSLHKRAVYLHNLNVYITNNALEESKDISEIIEEYITNSFAKEDVSVLNDIDEYRKVINDYRDRVYSQNTQSWYQKYMDGKNVLVDNTTGEIYYTFKKDLNLQAKKDAIVELTDSIVKFYNNKSLFYKKYSILLFFIIFIVVLFGKSYKFFYNDLLLS